MKQLKRNAMMYRAIKAERNINFKKSFYELNCGDLDALFDFSELFRIKPRYGVSPAKTLFYRMAEYEEKNIRNI